MIALAQKNKIKQWLKEIIEKGTWPDHDLHIDRISIKVGKDPTVWIKKTLEFYEFAQKELKHSNFRLVVTIPLKGTALPRVQDVIDINTLSATELSYTPPSLLLYEKDHPILAKIISESSPYPYLGDRGWLYNFSQTQDPDDSLFFSWIYLLKNTTRKENNRQVVLIDKP